MKKMYACRPHINNDARTDLAIFHIEGALCVSLIDVTENLKNVYHIWWEQMSRPSRVGSVHGVCMIFLCFQGFLLSPNHLQYDRMNGILKQSEV